MDLVVISFTTHDPTTDTDVEVTELWFCKQGGQGITDAATWARVQFDQTYTAPEPRE